MTNVVLRFIAAGALSLAGLLLSHTPAAADEPEDESQSRYRFYLDAGWPEGITYEVGTVTPELRKAGPLEYFEEIYLTGRIGARLDVDAAVFADDASLPDFRDGVEVRRAQFYVTGDFRLGLPLAYKFEFSVEGNDVFLNDFYLRWKPGRWVDSVDIGYITPPMSLENVISSRSLTLMEVAAPVQALAPGYRSGVAVAGHWEPWRLAWQTGFYSAGQEQNTGDASETSAQVVGRIAWLAWRRSVDPDASFVHVGTSASYVFSGSDQIRYRARPESFIAPFVVDTGDLPTDNIYQFAFEGAWARGPMLLSGEVLQSSGNAADGSDTNFRGTYGLFSWMLTGEPHPYNGTIGMFERLVPRRPVSFRNGTWGAWEVGQRISWLDLTDGPVRGGEMLTLASGITWHLNAEFRLSANYVFAHVTDGVENGDASIFQARIEIGI